MSYADASGACSRAGARLCSLDELAADETVGTGCGFDVRSPSPIIPCGILTRSVAVGADLEQHGRKLCRRLAHDCLGQRQRVGRPEHRARVHERRGERGLPVLR